MNDFLDQNYMNVNTNTKYSYNALLHFVDI